MKMYAKLFAPLLLLYPLCWAIAEAKELSSFSLFFPTVIILVAAYCAVSHFIIVKLED